MLDGHAVGRAEQAHALAAREALQLFLRHDHGATVDGNQFVGPEPESVRSALQIDSDGVTIAHNIFRMSPSSPIFAALEWDNLGKPHTATINGNLFMPAPISEVVQLASSILRGRHGNAGY